jgi:alcohol dehydrogenase class IV
MTPFQHATPAFRTFYGPGCLGSLGGELRRLGAQRIVVFCGASVARDPQALPRVERALGDACVGRFDAVREHSPVPSIEEGARVLERLRADGVVAVGGGSAVVSARASSILLAERRDVRALCTRRDVDGRLSSPKLLAPKLPQWVVATTPSTAFAKAGTAVRDPVTGERLAMFDPKTRAQALFVDPVLAQTAPVTLVQSASLNALSMAVTALEADADDPLADALLRRALGLFTQWLPRLGEQPDDPEVRGRLMLGALLCGQGTDYQGGGIAGVLGHGLGPRFGIPNGLAESIVLPHAMRFNAPAVGDRALRVCEALGLADDGRSPGERAVAGVDALLERLGIARRLRDLEIARDALEPVADAAMDDWFVQRNPRPVTRDDALALLHAAW